jgi:hypothetical protein
MPSLRKFHTTAFALCCLSCTIIEDNDILTSDQLDDLKLTAIDIIQETAAKNSTSTIRIVTDSAMNLSTSYGTVTRYVEMEMDGFTSGKLKFRSGVTGKITLYQTYLSGGRPNTFGIIKNDVIVELYRYRYSTNNQLKRINFFLGEDDLIYSDSMIYNSTGNISSMVREAPTEPGMNGTITMEYGGGNPVTVSRVRVGSLQFDQNNGNCPNNSSLQSCISYYRIINGQSGNNGSTSVMIKNDRGISLLNEVSIEDIRFDNGTTGQEADSYFFHPIMLNKQELELGDDLMSIYMIDWWDPQSYITGSPIQNERVRFKYNYGL